MIRRFLKKGAGAVRQAARVGKGIVLGPDGPGHGVADYEDFDRLRQEAAAQDAEEGVVTAGSEMEVIAEGTPEIDAEALRILLEVEEAEDRPMLVDVREVSEWQGGHIAGAVHIPLAQLDERASAMDPSRSFILVCASGMRSVDGSYVLKRRGFERVLSLAGGIQGWVEASNELVVPD